MDPRNEISGKVSQWLTSPEAQEKLKEAHNEAEKAAEYLREASRIDPESLHKPFNI
jgi:DNA-directed RNA polymerase subunit F